MVKVKSLLEFESYFILQATILAKSYHSASVSWHDRHENLKREHSWYDSGDRTFPIDSSHLTVKFHTLF